LSQQKTMNKSTRWHR